MRAYVTAFTVLMFVGIAHAQSYGPPTYSVGDTWTIKEEGITRDIKVVAVDADGYSIEGAYSGCPTCRVHTDKNLRWLKILDANDKPTTQATWVPLGTDWKFLDFPLEVGKKWRISSTGMVRGQFLTDYTVDCVVEAYEDIQTLAGTFKAFRVRRDWSASSRGWRDAWHQVSWYAPDVKTVIKFTTSAKWGKNWELVSYSLK